jgi:hypothetical protein
MIALWIFFPDGKWEKTDKFTFDILNDGGSNNPSGNNNPNNNNTTSGNPSNTLEDGSNSSWYPLLLGMFSHTINVYL